MAAIEGWATVIDNVPRVYPSIAAARAVADDVWPVLLDHGELRDRFTCECVLAVPLRQLWTTPSTRELVLVAVSVEGHPYVVCSGVMTSQEPREFSFTVERSGDTIADGTITARSAEDAIHKVVSERKDLQGQDAVLHIARPTGDETGDTASATWGDLHVRVAPKRETTTPR